jgi:hypothetical protein
VRALANPQAEAAIPPFKSVVTPRWPTRALLLVAGLAAACSRQEPKEEALTAAQAAPVQSAVSAYLHTVAADVTREGPIAWRRHFSLGPGFFMAVDGRLAFPDGATAATAIQELTRTLPHIELRWGDDIRVDALTPRLAGVATSYNEVTVNAAGQRSEASGYFTGVVENRDGRWRFLNAHWSSLQPTSPGTR